MLKTIVYVALLGIILYFVSDYFKGCKYKTDVKLDGKVAIITGANTGIGKATTIDFVQRGAKVYMACRSMDRGQEALDDILKQTIGVSTDKLVLLKLDLSSLASVRDFAKEFKKREQKLDILVNNAGIMWVPYSETVDGYESTFATNHLGHFLLTNLLVGELITAAPSRVVTVSSMGHAFTNMNFDDLMGKKDYGRVTSYSQSKLANVLFAKELAKRLKDSGVTSFSLHPGAVMTELGRYTPIINIPAVRDIFFFLMTPFFKDSWYGARTSVYCSVEPGLEAETGKYFSDCAIKDPLPEAEDAEVAKRLWKISVELTKLSDDEIHPTLKG